MRYYPTFGELVDPGTLPGPLQEAAREARLRDPVSPANLLNMSWLAGDEPGWLLLPRAIHGLACDILVLSGRHFPSGSHKVGPVYSILREKELAGEVDRSRHTIVCPSTGNYGIGGAWVGARMGYDTLVVLPEEMSRERFEMIEGYGATIIKTPGCESNVKEIFDEVNRLRRDERYVILEQFSEMGNYRFHYHVTGETIQKLAARFPGHRLAALVSAMGSGGTIAAGDYLKKAQPGLAVVGLEPVQCPTLFNVGVGPHRIEGIGDKHVTWIHNVHNMDWLFGIDDGECLAVMQLFQEGGDLLAEATGCDRDESRSLRGIFGPSGVCNVMGAVRTAHQLGLGRGDLIATFATDGFDRYPSVLDRWRAEQGPLDGPAAERALQALRRPEHEYALEGTARVRERWHNQKYFTWVEQQGKTVEQWQALAAPGWWEAEAAKSEAVDRAILERR